ncbi:hypothetical protein GGI23_000918 [Coemansia sp. RSA 2559]|nr:hypothetical protein GGI23_000918 [Coemansia sp. RSA 2559]
MRLETTADIAAAMDAAAAGDKNALRAIQATGMQSDLDDTPAEPADPRTEFPTQGLMGSGQPLPPHQKQPYAAGPQVAVPPQSATVEKPKKSQQVKLPQNVRDRLIKARMKQKQSQQKRQQQQDDNDEKTDA